MDFDIHRERLTRDRAQAIVHDAERLRNLIDTLPMRTDDMLRWRMALTDMQANYLDLVRACDLNLKGT
jgi:hypothetical protein